MKKIYFFAAFLLSTTFIANSQGVSVNSSGSAPDPSAIFDASSTTKGALIPRMTTLQRNSIVSPAVGLQIYNLDCNNFNYYNGASWVVLNGPPVIASISASPAGAICSGASVTFTATAINGGTAPAYQWQVNGINAGSDSSSYTYTPSNGDVITCVLTSNLACVSGSPATSNAITEIVYALPPVAINPSSISTCSSSGTDTLTASGGVTYLWSNSATTTSIIVNPSSSATYSVTAASANGCTAQASASVTVNTYSVPITLSNGSGQSTGTGFSQMITVNSSNYSPYESSGLQNVEFTSGPGATGSILQAWIESGIGSDSTSTVYWVNLGSISISGNGSVTIYMNFMASNIMSASGPTGEAPQLSGTYAQYDNGANVFTNYWNFAGNSLPANWTTNDAGNGAYATVNNGVTVHSRANGSWNRGGLGYNIAMPNSYVAETYLEEIRGLTYGNYGNFAIFPYAPSNISSNSTSTTLYLDDAGDGWIWQASAGTETGGGNAEQTTNSYGIYSYYVNGSSAFYQENYGSSTPAETGYTSATYIGFGSFDDTENAYWVRTRTFLTGGAMPGVSFGAGGCQ